MEGRLPTINCLLQHSLRSLCACSDSSSSSPSKWVYAVFWRILPRNYPPPKWDYGGSLLDRTKGNKRNWILVWEDGYCDFVACENAANGYSKGIRFGADIFFKMSHEVYNFGEGMVGKVASDYSHKWVYSDSQDHNESSFISSWNASTDHQPKAWEAQFSSGIETIAIISVREGAIQLGSFDKVLEDLTLVLSIQRKFSYLHSIPGVYTVQRPYVPAQNPSFLADYPNSLMKNEAVDVKPQITRFKRQRCDQNESDSASQSVYSGNSSPKNRLLGTLPLYSIPPLLPSMPYNVGAFLWKINSNPAAADHEETSNDKRNGSLKSGGMNQNMAVEEIWGSDSHLETSHGGLEEQERPQTTMNQKLKSEDD